MGAEQNRLITPREMGFSPTGITPHIPEARKPETKTKVSFPEAILAGRTFLGDPTLVHGEIKIQSSHMPPAARGEYSLQIIREDTDVKRIQQAKVLVVGCMDKRQAESLYQSALDGRMATGSDRKKYTPDDIVMITVGGGIIQTGEREADLQKMIDFVIDQAPGLEHVVVSAHTSDPESEESSPCGGVKFLNGGKPLPEILTDETIRQLREKYQTEIMNSMSPRILNGPELLATGEAARRHAADTLAAHRDHPTLQAHVWIAVPNDETHGIRTLYKTVLDETGTRLDAMNKVNTP